MNFDQEISVRAVMVDDFLVKHFDIYRNEYKDMPKALLDSVSYSLSSGGKRFRPVLSLLVAEHYEEDPMTVLPFAAAVEMIHTYSLIHDDLPCMDNDDFRRGRPTNHKVFGEATALLAGDALLTEAFQVITKFYNTSPQLVCDLVSKLSMSIGIAGMVGGQALDMQAEKVKVDLEALKSIHKLKTGYLIRTALEGAAIACDAHKNDILALRFYGDALGMAFQIADDILDAEDPNQGSRSFVSLMGVDGSKEHLLEVSRKAKEFLNKLSKPAPMLLQVVEYNLQRSK